MDDPVLTEIVRHGVLAVTSEMKTNLMRTAYNTIIYEALDFTVGLYTPEGDTVSIGLGLPMFIRGMAEAAISTISPSRSRSITRARSSPSPAAWRIGSTSAARSAR